ncbi:methionyl-tRNA formyltransferase [Motiliproteus sediminis]|uniref:methionyl-tRNA formyltransferase n=1 Tax=Motiliproteus sediminis TaxID=1468178 RepID=UPI001AEF934B|nr:methionyl-tRNA formyltransferase [Motiliproteus sediminis]
MSHSPLRIIFAGTPEFAAVSLDALIQSDHQIVAVYTQPDRPAGRGRKLTPSPVKVAALEAGITVCQPLNFKDEEDRRLLASFDADLMIVAAYGLLLPKAVLQTPRLGCINIHASLLPRWRGAAPIHRALLADDSETGITIMQMDEGLDTGAMRLKLRCPIAADDTSGTLHDRLAELGAEALLDALEQLQRGTLPSEVQDSSQATYAHKLTKEEGLIDWQRPASELARQVRGLNPWPVAYSSLQGERVRVWEAQALEHGSDQQPGTLINADRDGLQVATGQGILSITRLQLPNARQLAVADLLNARQDLFRAGNRFDIEPA